MMKVYRFVLFSYATELTRLVSVSVGLVVLGLGLITVFFLVSVSVSVLVLHSLVSVLALYMFWSH